MSRAEGSFWVDLAEDMQDPEYAAVHVAEAAKISAIDDRVTALAVRAYAADPLAFEAACRRIVGES